VNAILDSTSTEWQSNNEVHYEIRTLIMTDVGMLPTFDALIVILVVLSSVSVVSIVYSVWRKRRK
ncbi:MAG: hypothetical protein ACXAAR_09695, partial [Candidatus Thorarchaeota archaeon]|jgi:hypothetical protein